MKSFFKTVGLGILYVLLLPFLLVYLVLYAVYLFFRMPVYFFQRIGSKKKVDEMDKKATNILDNNRYVKEEPKKETTVIEKEGGEKVVYHTTNIFVTSPEQAKNVKKYIDSNPEALTHTDQENIKELQSHMTYEEEIPHHEVPLIEDDEVEEEKHVDYYGPQSLKRKDD